MKQLSGNKRKHRRFTVDVMDIKGSVLVDIGVMINDISIAGASLYADRKLDLGQGYVLRIADKDSEVLLQGTVAWISENEQDACRDGDILLKYSAGLQFLPLRQESVSRLVKFIETHLIDHHTKFRVHEMSGSRCNIRFRVDVKEKATLNFARYYRVRELSLGGILIKSSHALELESRLCMDVNIAPDIHLTVTGRVASCIQTGDQTGANFDIGIGFIDMPGQDRAKLKEFIRRLYLEDAGFSDE